jgi:hypothetical protein
MFRWQNRRGHSGRHEKRVLYEAKRKEKDMQQRISKMVSFQSVQQADSSQQTNVNSHHCLTMSINLDWRR